METTIKRRGADSILTKTIFFLSHFKSTKKLLLLFFILKINSITCSMHLSPHIIFPKYSLKDNHTINNNH